MLINVPQPKADSVEEWQQYIAALWKDPDNARRKATSKELVDYYRYLHQPYFEAELAKIFTDPHSLARKRHWFQNYTKQLTDGLAQCYDCIVKRQIAGLSPDDQTAVSDILFRGLDGVMTTANKWLVMERTTLAYARWSKKHSRVKYQAYNQYQFDLVFDPNSDDRELLGVILSDYRDFAQARIFVYTANNTYQFLGSRLVSQVSHGRGLLPFVVLYAEDPGSEDYIEPLGAITRANLELNLAQANLLNVLHNQAHGLVVLKTPQPFTGIDESDPNQSQPGRVESDTRIDIHDPNKILNLHYGEDGQQEPKLEILAPQADFDGAINTIRFMANSLAQSFGYGSDTFDVDVNAKKATVFHINERRRQALIGDYHTVFRDAEAELFSLALQIAQIETVVPAMAPEDFQIEFAPDQALVSGPSSAEILAMREAGVIDTIEAIRSHYPSLDRGEAEAFLREMAEAEQRLAELLPKQQAEAPAEAPVDEQPEAH